MSEAKHTPGPWTFDHDWHRLPTVLGADGRHVCLIEKKREIAECKANAALIAAAPDLLTALKALRIQALQSSVADPANEWGREALALTSAAIAKAEGRAP